MKLIIDVSSYSDIGGRVENEDTVLRACGSTFCLAAVADGLGGHGGGAMASSKALMQLGASLEQLSTPSEQAVREVLQQMNEAVLAAQTQSCRMKTTLALALLYNDRTTVFAHVGDSRIYHFREGRILARSLDHSVSQLAVLAGEITEDQIRFHEDRNRVLRVLGSEESSKADISIMRDNLRPGDALLLCSDGFWEYVLEDEMLGLLKRTSRSKEWLESMVKTLLSRAGAGHDNNSAVAVRVSDGNGWTQRRR